MKQGSPINRLAALVWQGAVLFGALALTQAHAQDKAVYRCPGNLYTDALSAKEAAAKGCKTLEGAPITVIQSQMPRTTPRSSVTLRISSAARLEGRMKLVLSVGKRRLVGPRKSPGKALRHVALLIHARGMTTIGQLRGFRSRGS